MFLGASAFSQRCTGQLNKKIESYVLRELLNFSIPVLQLWKRALYKQEAATRAQEGPHADSPSPWMYHVARILDHHLLCPILIIVLGPVSLYRLFVSPILNCSWSWTWPIFRPRPLDFDVFGDFYWIFHKCCIFLQKTAPHQPIFKTLLCGTSTIQVPVTC